MTKPSEIALSDHYDPSSETHCPDGLRQRLCHPLSFRERNVGELELRVLLGPGEGGVCQVIVEERGEEVYVRVLVHCADEDDVSARPDREYMDCPCGSNSMNHWASAR